MTLGSCTLKTRDHHAVVDETEDESRVDYIIQGCLKDRFDSE